MADTQAVSADIAFPTGQEVYDQLMVGIEPDLVSAAIPTLERKYAGESPEMRRARFDRYERAYAQYDIAFSRWMEHMNAEVIRHRRVAMRSAERKSKEKEGGELIDLEAQIREISS